MFRSTCQVPHCQSRPIASLSTNQLRTVEGALALVQRELDTRSARRVLQRLFGTVPHVIAPTRLAGRSGELHLHVVEAEIAIDREQQLNTAHALHELVSVTKT